jgi:hypothetical protein
MNHRRFASVVRQCVDKCISKIPGDALDANDLWEIERTIGNDIQIEISKRTSYSSQKISKASKAFVPQLRVKPTGVQQPSNITTSTLSHSESTPISPIRNSNREGKGVVTQERQNSQRPVRPYSAAASGTSSRQQSPASSNHEAFSETRVEQSLARVHSPRKTTQRLPPRPHSAIESSRFASQTTRESDSGTINSTALVLSSWNEICHDGGDGDSSVREIHKKVPLPTSKPPRPHSAVDHHPAIVCSRDGGQSGAQGRVVSRPHSAVTRSVSHPSPLGTAGGAQNKCDERGENEGALVSSRRPVSASSLSAISGTARITGVGSERGDEVTSARPDEPGSSKREYSGNATQKKNKQNDKNDYDRLFGDDQDWDINGWFTLPYKPRNTAFTTAQSVAQWAS